MSTDRDSSDAAPPCWNCGRALDTLLRPVSRHEYCAHCAEPVHCCRACLHFAPAKPGQCAEDRAEPPSDKSAANFCDFFALNEAGRAAAGSDAEEDARARLDALFGGGGDAPEASAGRAAGAAHDDRERRARAGLEDLFGGGSDGD